MPDYLKRASVAIASIGATLELRQLSAKAHAETVRAYDTDKTGFLAGAVAVKYGVPEWAEKTPDEILDMLTSEQIGEITEAIAALSGVDAKKSATPSAGSSSN